MKRLLLDANVLLLLVVGSVAPEFVRSHKRLQAFSAEDFALLKEVVDAADEVTATVNAWTEVSNILDFGVAKPLRNGLIWGLKRQIDSLSEIYVTSRSVCADLAFWPLGLSDAAALMATNDRTTLLTTDVPLYEQALARGCDALNFHHLREQRGLV